MQTIQRSHGHDQPTVFEELEIPPVTLARDSRSVRNIGKSLLKVLDVMGRHWIATVVVGSLFMAWVFGPIIDRLFR